jgi:RimJ/RimL family protein N-acetyltransferase
MRGLFVGNNVKLTSIKESDITSLEDWFNDVYFLRHYDILPAVPMSKKQLENLLKYYEDSEERCIFAIRKVQTNELIGITGFDNIIWSNGVATLYIGIGNKSARGKGFGKEALNLLIDYGFNELNFHRIQLNVISYNTNAIKLYESLGFIKEGVCRELIFRDGNRYDLFQYGLLRTEWSGQQTP